MKWLRLRKAQQEQRKSQHNLYEFGAKFPVSFSTFDCRNICDDRRTITESNHKQGKRAQTSLLANIHRIRVCAESNTSLEVMEKLPLLLIKHFHNMTMPSIKPTKPHAGAANEG